MAHELGKEAIYNLLNHPVHQDLFVKLPYLVIGTGIQTHQQQLRLAPLGVKAKLFAQRGFSVSSGHQRAIQIGNALRYA